MSEPLTNCPKCGFEQPVDQYCASCGVDMTLVPKKSEPLALSKKPALLGGIAVFLIVITILGVRTARRSSPADAQTASATALASTQEHQESRSESRRESKHGEAVFEKEAAESHARANAPDDGAGATMNASDSAGTGGPTNSSSLSPTTGPTSDGPASPAAAAPLTKTANAEAGLEISFAWAEVSPQWLQALGHQPGSPEPTLHLIADPKTQLRETGSSYRIVDMAHQRFATEKNEPYTISRGDRLAVRFDATAIAGPSVTGTLYVSTRASDGTVRPPLPMNLRIERGQGVILTFGSLGPSAIGTEIVVLILPRWGADRNP